MCEQLDLFNCTSERFKITKSIRLIELFAGYGSQYMALKRLQDEGLCKVESWKVVEFDKHVINSYNVIHGTEYLPKDIREIKGNDLRIEDTESFTYLLTPFLARICQTVAIKKECQKEVELEVDCFGKLRDCLTRQTIFRKF